jgi:hypothetical protein
MATDLRPQPKTEPTSRHEQFVEQQLERARRRIRNLDTFTAVLTLLIGVLLYGLVMGGLDRAFDLDAGIRGAAFVVAAAAAALYAGLIVFRRIQWHVNPFYAARRLEQTIPNAKNSLINWLDLRDESMPPVIRGTLGRKAAKDLNGANLENAVSSRHTLWLAAAAAGLALALLIWFLMGPSQVASLLQRAFAPFEKVPIATRTTIKLLAPAGGDATVPVKQDVQIRVEVTDRVPRVNQPDALKLHYRYRQSDPYIVKPLEEDADGQWFKTITADDLGGGFYYKVTGGDDATREYQVKVRALPSVAVFEAKYHYRPYLCRPDREVRYGPSERIPRPEMREMRGTEVTLVARTNRVWGSGHLALREGPVEKKLEGEPVADDAQARSFKFVLNESGEFQVLFTSTEGETNIDRKAYPITVITDEKPVVIVHRPKNIELPANGTLSVSGRALDDHGLKAMTLRLRVKTGPQTPDLEPKPYRPGVSFKDADKRYPRELTYNDWVALEKLKTAKGGEPFPLSAGMVLEYWLEAVDNCDYPEATGNVGESKRYEVTIVAPDKDEKRQQKQRAEAQQQKDRHDKQQDQQQRERNQEIKENEKAAQQDPAERDKQLQKERKDFEQKADEIRQELERQQQEAEKKGSARGDSSSESRAENKEKGPEQTGAGAGEKNDEKNQPKEGQAAKSKGGKGQEKADAKGAGDRKKQKEGQQQAGNEKGAGQSNPQNGSQGQVKDNKGPSKDQAPSQVKGQGNQQPDQPPGAEKSKGGGAEQKADAARSKDDGKGGMGGGERQAAGKESGGTGAMPPQTAQAKGDGKSEGSGQPQQAQTAPKDGPKDGTQNQVAQGKGAGDKKGPPEASQAKGLGQQAKNDQPPGQGQRAEGGVRGQQPPQARGSEKGPGDKDKGNGAQNAASAKGDPKGQQSAAAAQKKTADLEKSQNAGLGKAERGADEPRGAGQPPRREDATMEDVARLKDRLERGTLQEESLDELSQVRKAAHDPAVRKAAEDLLKEQGHSQLELDHGQAKNDNKTPQKTAKAAPKGPGQTDPKSKQPDKGEAKGKGPNQDEQQVGKGKDEGENGKGQQSANMGEPKKGGNRWGEDRVGRGTVGGEEDGAANPVDRAAASRAGELQLENLRDRLKKNKNLWKKMGWKNEEDLDRFLRQARKYQEWLRQQEKLAGTDKQTAPGGKSVLPGIGPQKVGPRPGATRDPLELGVAQPPPEFREAQRIFTGKTRE